MSLVKCKECGGQVSTKAKTCPGCGVKPPKKTTVVAWAALAFIIVAGLGAYHDYSERVAYQSLKPEQRAIVDKERAAREEDIASEIAKEVANKAEKERENKRKGLHCLSGWDGSHKGVNRYVAKNIRDPDSFNHIETRISAVNGDGVHYLTMRYRAKNGFGGMTISRATAAIDNSSCRSTIISLEN